LNGEEGERSLRSAGKKKIPAAYSSVPKRRGENRSLARERVRKSSHEEVASWLGRREGKMVIFMLAIYRRRGSEGKRNVSDIQEGKSYVSQKRRQAYHKQIRRRPCHAPASSAEPQPAVQKGRTSSNKRKGRLRGGKEKFAFDPLKEGDYHIPPNEGIFRLGGGGKGRILSTSPWLESGSAKRKSGTKTLGKGCRKGKKFP